LGDSEQSVRRAAVGALGRLGGQTTTPSSRDQINSLLIPLLRDQHAMVRQATAQALSTLRWQPNEDEIGVSDWVARQDWEKCLQIGAAVSNPTEDHLHA